MPDLPRLLPLGEVATALHVDEATLRRWARRREFPRLYRLGRMWRVAAEDVATWLAQRPGDPDRDELRRSYLLAAGGADSRARPRRASRDRARADTSKSSGGSHGA
jgi:excisionase family DNA binding protein